MTAKVPSLCLLSSSLFSHDQDHHAQQISPSAASPQDTVPLKQANSLSNIDTSGLALHTISSPTLRSAASHSSHKVELCLKGWDVLPSAFIPTLSTHPLPDCLINVPPLTEPIFWNHSRGTSTRFEHWDVNVRSYNCPSPRHALSCVRHVLIDEGLSGNHATLHLNGFVDPRHGRGDHSANSGSGILKSPLMLSRSFSSLSGTPAAEPVKFHVAVDISKFVASRPTCLLIPNFESVEQLLEYCRSMTVLKAPPGVDLKGHPDHFGAEISIHALAQELARECELLGFKHQVRVSVEMQHAVTHLTLNNADSSYAVGDGDGRNHLHFADGVKTLAKEISTSLGDIWHHALGGHDFRWEKGDLVARCSWTPNAQLRDIVDHVMHHAHSPVSNCVQLEAEGSLR